MGCRGRPVRPGYEGGVHRQGLFGGRLWRARGKARFTALATARREAVTMSSGCRRPTGRGRRPRLDVASGARVGARAERVLVVVEHPTSSRGLASASTNEAIGPLPVPTAVRSLPLIRSRTWSASRSSLARSTGGRRARAGRAEVLGAERVSRSRPASPRRPASRRCPGSPRENSICMRVAGRARGRPSAPRRRRPCPTGC